MTDCNTYRGLFAALVMAATLIGGAGAASAATVQVTLDFGTTDGVVSSPYVEDGFEVSAGGFFPDSLFFSLVGNPAPSVLLDIVTNSMTLKRVGGGAFSLVSFDYSCSGGECNLSVGTTSITSGSFSSSDFATAVPVGLTNITSLQFTRFGSSHRIDNIVLSYDDATPIPLPAGLPLLLGGLAGLGLVARRRARAA